MSGEVALTEVAGFWVGSTTLDHDLGDLTYHFRANDTSSNFEITGDLTASVFDNDNPSINLDSSDASGTTGDIYNFNITASDNIDVASVNVTWSHGSFGGNTVLTKVSGFWVGSISLDHNISALTYQVMCGDANSDQDQSQYA